MEAPSQTQSVVQPYYCPCTEIYVQYTEPLKRLNKAGLQLAVPHLPQGLNRLHSRCPVQHFWLHDTADSSDLIASFIVLYYHHVEDLSWVWIEGSTVAQDGRGPDRRALQRSVNSHDDTTENSSSQVSPVCSGHFIHPE